MTMIQTLRIRGEGFVVIPQSDYERLCEQATRKAEQDELPRLPVPDAEGCVPALAFGQATIARDIIRERKALGLSQEQLAKAAGVRPETLSRLESGKHSPTVRTVEKIDGALKRLARKNAKR